jgi:hypothetical protein
MAKRKQAASEADQATPTETNAGSAAPTLALVTEAGQGMDEARATRFPDPREHKSISLGSDRDSPRIRLLRSQRFNQMQIRADEQLPDASREQLKAAGWTERPEEGIFTKQLPPRPKTEGEETKPAWPTVLEAERQFHELANSIRSDKGLPPVTEERGAGQQR